MKIPLLIIFAFLLPPQNLFAQTPHFRNYTVDDGLPSSHVYRAFQDSKGFMWFCTDKGVARFDGYKFEKFSTKNGLPNNDIWHCAEDSEQRIWFLSYANAFFYFDLKDNKFHVIANPYEDSHDAHVWCYIQEGKDYMRLTLSDNTIYKINLNSHSVKIVNTKITEDYPLIKNTFFYNGFEHVYEKWYLRAYSEGLQHNIINKPHVLPKLNTINNKFWNDVATLIFDDDKTIYGNNDSLAFFKNGVFKSNKLKNLSNYKNDKLNLVLNAGNPNRKMVITEKDLFVINENIERMKNLDFIKKLNPNTIFFDFNDNIWICSKNNGIFLLSEKSVESKVYDQFSKQSVTTLNKDYFNRVWIGNNEGEVFYVDGNKNIFEKYFKKSLLSPVKQISSTPNRIFVLWYNTKLALFPNKKNIKLDEFNDELNFKFIESDTLLKSKKIVRILEKSKENNIIYNSGAKILFCAANNTLFLGNYDAMSLLNERASRYEFTSLSSYNVILSLKILALLGSTKTNTVFVGTNKGIEIVNNYEKLSDVQTLKQKYPILSKPISCFAEDSEYALWAGTDGYGVYRYYKNQTIEIPELKGMIINNLYSEKEHNRLWVATNEGIILLKLDLKSNQFKYDIQRISLAQGLPTLEVNCMVVRDNDLFVGTSKGLAILPIQNIIDAKKQIVKTPLIIKNIKINRRDTTLLGSYDLTYLQNNIDIEFVALSFKSDKNIKYDYKMISDNSDTLWHPVQDLHKEFSLLSPGRYEFLLRAFDIDGNATKAVKPIIFTINPPFWEIIWFRVLVVMLLLSAIIFYFYLRTLAIKKKAEEKTKINKKFAELELQALQAQMNPHFVFNALSAIQNFILNNDPEEATDYLSRFSRLMRLFLESSRNKYIALSEEKILLEYYIQLEQLRFKDKFTYEIFFDESVSLDTEIPSLLLQPFVENAINHGLVYKTTNDGYLKIHFKKENSKLICIVDDNGIGRIKAAEIKKKSLKPYKSRGTEITEERLRSLELIENTKIEIEISDKINENLLPQGTKVTIVMYL